MTQTKEFKKQFIPKTWLNIQGEERVTGPGHTRYREWINEYEVPILIAYHSHTSGFESVVAKIVGLYFDNKSGDALGILVQKRMKAGWTEKQLILLNRTEHLVDLKNNVVIVGHPNTLGSLVLQNLHDQISKSRVSENGNKNEIVYIEEVISYLSGDFCNLLDHDIDHLLTTLNDQNSIVVERLKAAISR